MPRSCPFRDLGPTTRDLRPCRGIDVDAHDRRSAAPDGVDQGEHMCTVLISYSTPPGPDEPVAEVTAGVDEAIAAAIADELTNAGHRVTCRPSVATPGTEDFD